MTEAELTTLKADLRLKNDEQYQIVREELAHRHKLNLVFLDKLHKQERKAHLAELGIAEHRPSQADELVALARAGASLFFHDDDAGYAVVAMPHKGGEHHETWPLRSSGFRSWLALIFFNKNQKAANGEAVANAINTLEGFARFDGPEHKAAMRIAERNGKIYLDLANDRWEAVEVDRDGWRIVEAARCDVFFRRTRAMKSIPDPIHQNKAEALAALKKFVEFLNFDEGSRPLAIAWLIAALRPTGPYPVLDLHGEQGAAKSSAARYLRMLLDPNKAITRAAPRDVRDIQIAANNGWVVSLDNLSHLPTWLSDALCRLSTGGGSASRALYTDGDEYVIDAQRPILLNGIEELTTRGDLLDRAILAELEAISKTSRKQERKLDRAFEAMRPKVLGALLDAVACALKNLADLTISELPRMADFAAWVVAAESALPLGKGDFLKFYLANIAAGNHLTLEASVIFPLLEKALPFSGTASELLDQLEARLPDPKKKPDEFPGNARALSGALKRIAPNMRRSGFSVEWSRETRIRTISIEKSCEDSGTPPGDANGRNRDAKMTQAENFASSKNPQEQRDFSDFVTHDAKDANSPTSRHAGVDEDCEPLPDKAGDFASSASSASGVHLNGTDITEDDQAADADMDPLADEEF